MRSRISPVLDKREKSSILQPFFTSFCWSRHCPSSGFLRSSNLHVSLGYTHKVNLNNKKHKSKMAPSKWGYTRIITGTIFGGIMGFYVMHRVEESYKEKMKERLAKYEAEMNRKGELNQNSKEEIGKDKAEILSEA